MPKCRYRYLKGYAEKCLGEATTNVRGFELCANCNQRLRAAEVVYDTYTEAYYAGVAQGMTHDQATEYANSRLPT